MMRQRVLTMAALVSALTFAPAANAHEQHLSKRKARTEALRFVQPIVDLLDLDRTVTAHMVTARDCRRVSRVTVTCRFSAYLAADGRKVGGSVRVHLQRNGLLGFLLPWNPADVWVESAPPIKLGLGEATSL